MKYLIFLFLMLTMVASAETLESVKGKDLAVTFPAPSTSNAASTGGAVGYWKRHKQKKTTP